MIVVDTETTGIDPEKHSIVSIGALDFSDPQNQFYEECRVFDGAEITDEALKINGFSRDEIQDPKKKSLEEIIKSFLKWTENCKEKTLAGENPCFDRDFLIKSTQRYNLKWNLGYRTVDLHSLCYSYYLKTNLDPLVKNQRTDINLDKILQYIGLPSEPHPHNALMGAKMEAEAFSRLIHRKVLFQEFKKYQIPDHI